MKGGLVSMLYGAAAARELGLLDGARIVLHLVCDEETGSAVGSGYLREAGLIDPDALAMLTAEPTGGVVWHALPRRDHAARHVRGPRGARRLRDHGVQRVRAACSASPRRSTELLRPRAGRRRARCSWSAADAAAARTSTSCPARPGSRSTAASTPTRTSTRRSNGSRARSTAAGDGAEAIEVLQRAPSAQHGPAHPRGPRARARSWRGRGRRARLRAVPGRARDALVRAARHSGVRLRRRPPRRLPRPRRVHRRGRDAPLRRRLRAFRGGRATSA